MVLPASFFLHTSCISSTNSSDIFDLSPIKEGICDSCGGSLKSRSDDTEETFINRFDTYMKETFPLIEYYDNKNNLVKIDVTNKNSDEVFEEVEKVIK